ncbi:MAG: glycosyltransferase family 39 protein [Myxococcales bacterium]
MHRRKRVAAAAVLVAVLLFWGAALYGIKSPFYYGHYGYHGGSYATWARGTLRHHTLLPVNEPGFAPPRPGTYYIHHPVLTHQLVTLTFLLFGEHEWSIRLAGLLPAFASLLLVAAIAWRYLGPLAGAVAALTFAVVPVNIWYSVNIDQGFPSIACLLAFFWFYLRWLETGRWSVAWAALAFQALAGGFEWSPYFAFPAVFAHVAWTAFRRRGRYLSFAWLHPLVVIVPLGAHVFAVRAAGMTSDFLMAYSTRAAAVGYRPFVRSMAMYGETLFGRVLLVVMFLWLTLTTVRVVHGRGRPVDLVGLTFAFALIAYVHVFKNAVITHAYRQLYGNVWAALAAADLVARFGRLAQALAATRTWPRPITARRLGLGVGLAGAASVLLATAPLAWAGLHESRAHGGIPGWKVFNPDLRQSVFAREVNRVTRPGDVVYFHFTFPSPPPSRMDWAFYYDRDLARGAVLRVLQALPPDKQRRAVVILVPGTLSGDERLAYAELARQHPIWQVNDLALLDLRSQQAVPDLRAYVISPEPLAARKATGALTRWLDGPYPWPRLVPDPQRAVAEQRQMQAALAARPMPVVIPVPWRGVVLPAGGPSGPKRSRSSTAPAVAARGAAKKPPGLRRGQLRSGSLKK